MAPLIQFLDDLGIVTLTNGEHLSEIWTLSNIFPERVEGLPIDITWGDDLKKLHDQITGVIPFNASPVPSNMNAELRPYQKSGVEWVEKLRTMHLSGILADDMGLGKTLRCNMCNNPSFQTISWHANIGCLSDACCTTGRKKSTVLTQS